MRLSEKKRGELYDAIHESIMKKRIAVKHSRSVLGDKNANDIDDLLCRLERDIWVQVRKTLNISGS